MKRWGLMLLASLVVSGCATGQRRAQHLQKLFETVRTSHDEKQITAASKELQRATPKYAEEIKVLSAEMEQKAYSQAQEVIGKAESKSLVPELLIVYADKLKQFKDWFEEQMRVKTGGVDAQKRLGNVEVLIQLFAKIKDARTIPGLKQALEYEQLKYQASTAIGQIAGASDEQVQKATLNELVERAQTEKGINISGFKSAGLKRIVEELSKPGLTDKEKGSLIRQIKGSRDPEVNAVLKELALDHPDADVQSQAGLALVNSIILDPKVGDPEFVAKWASQPTKSTDQDYAKGWVVYAMDRTWDARYIPALIEMLQHSRSWSSRSGAAEILGRRRVAEAVPALESALLDNESGVRSKARGALGNILGKDEYMKRYFKEEFVHPKDREDFEELKKKYQTK